MIRVRVRYDQIGLVFNEGKFERVALEGSHWFNPFGRKTIELIDLRVAVNTHSQLREIAATEALNPYGEIVDLSDYQRALVWVEGRFFTILTPGIYFLSNLLVDVRIEVIDARDIQFEHNQLSVIAKRDQGACLDLRSVEREHVGLLYIDGRFEKSLTAGVYAFWKNVGNISVATVDLREQAFEIGGQELMSADKVTLRLNALITYRVEDPKRSIDISDDAAMALYRETQLVLRNIIGQRSLDEFLNDKEQLAELAAAQLQNRAQTLGLTIVGIGIKDVILPGEMKDLMNRVIEARKAAEANLIFRREETAAIRSQANSAKLLDSNPTLMRLRELEVIEKVAQSTNLQVVLGDKAGLSDQLRKIV